MERLEKQNIIQKIRHYMHERIKSKCRTVIKISVKHQSKKILIQKKIYEDLVPKMIAYVCMFINEIKSEFTINKIMTCLSL